jgi:DNA-binding IclR family transcriptional regulator
MAMTPHQAKTFDTLLEMTAELGRAPSLTELGARMGLNKGAAHKHMDSLKRLGAIKGPVVVGEWRPTPLGKKLRKQA